ncbi:MAG: CheR family methyltransferase [Chitinophagales bacterium]
MELIQNIVGEVRHGKKLRVVGIGASAGGLEAMRQFFSHIPDNIDASFVIIQHLSPDFKSLMDEILARYTKIPILTVNHDMPVYPNHIYLIPRDKNIVIKNGVLLVVNRSGKLNLPIDIFLHSLGHDQGSNAIGVILSGTGTDGSRGTRTIKEAGGIVLVQDPNSAKFNGMPLATISIGLADNVLTPSLLAETVTKLANTFPHKLLDEENDISLQGIFKRILLKVYNATGIDFEAYRKQTLLRRSEKRMQLNHIYKIEDYDEYMEVNPSEAKLLGKEFLIGVTRFFRNPEAFEILQERIIPEIVKNKNSYETIRIWIAACSTGEEAYSIAMLMMEYMVENDLPPNFKIFATDVDDLAINFASEGVYHDNIVADVSSKRLEQFFDLKMDKFHIKKKLRERIIFVNHDVLQDPPFINADLICCRNFLIYLNTDVQKRLLENYHYSLNQGGYLFLGPSESIGNLKQFFHSIDQKWNIYENVYDVVNTYSKKAPAWVTKNFASKTSRKSTLKPSESSSNSEDNYLNYKRQETFFTSALVRRHSPICLFLSKELDVLFINGNVGQLFHFPQALVRMNIENLLESQESLLFRNGVRRALETRQTISYKDVPFNKYEELFNLDINFSWVHIPEVDNKVVLVEIFIKGSTTALSSENVLEVDAGLLKEERVRTLELELKEVKEQKKSLIEELESINVELQASNEELLATNEELQSTNEELQSVNEELYTVNTELQSKIEEYTTINNDIANLLKSTEIATIFLDNYLRIRKFTSAISEQLDLVDSDIGRSITTFSHTLKNVDLAGLAKKVLLNLNTIEKEVIDIHDNFFLMRILPYRTSENMINGVVITFTNINEVKSMAAKNLATSSRYKAVFENAIDNLSIYDREGTFLDLNFTFTGYHRDEVIGTIVYDRVTPENKDIIKYAIDKVFETGENVFYNLDFILPHGEVVFIEAKVSPIFRDGNVEEVAITTRDLSDIKARKREIKRLNEELEQKVEERTADLEDANEYLEELNSFLDDFVNGAIHDLRAPILRMKSYVESLSKAKDEADRKKLLERVGMASQKLESVLNGLMQFLDFQKNGSHAILNINIKDIFYEVKTQLTDQLSQLESTIQTDFNDSPNFYYVKPYLVSMVYNVLDNAIKYRDDNRPLEISVKVKEQDGYVVFSVADNGIGIDLERYGHLLFQPFQRIATTREGAGIGLSILNNTIKKNGGKIEVQSELGKGTVFTVHIKPYTMIVDM